MAVTEEGGGIGKDTAGRGEDPMRELFDRIPRLTGERICLRPLVQKDADALGELTGSSRVYRYLPTFLYEKKNEDPRRVIRGLYDECLEESLILGVFEGERFCGLAEFYGLRVPIRKISVGYRLLERCWGRGIATEALGLLTGYLLRETEIEIVTASTMVENIASARVLKKNGFVLVAHGAPEDWGYEAPTPADKWIL